MKKLFGLALIGLMAGTAGAAAKDSIYTRLDTVKTIAVKYDFGAVVVGNENFKVHTLSVNIRCDNYTSGSLVTKAKCNSIESNKENFLDQWTVTKIDTTSTSNVEGDIVASIYGEKSACPEDNADCYKNLNITENVTVSNIDFKRTFVRNSSDNTVASTVVFPFSFASNCVSGATFSKLETIAYNKNGDNIWRAHVKMGESTIEAHTPYIVKATGSSLTFSPSCNYTFEPGSAKNYTVNLDYHSSVGESYSGSWNFVGTYDMVQWGEDNSELGKVYGFAANSKGSVSAGQFVKASAGASVPAMRAYLKYVPSISLQKAAFGAVSALPEEDLPTSIELVFEDGDKIMAIGQLNTRTGEISVDENLWFDLKGRKLNKKPTVKGTYYNNGQKVIIK
ncbi:MAG: hypothetical protein MJZ05_07860 [Fibrobacter sp.]|nr:hypothetical protein [Fibrobacter sp.]